MLNCFRYLEFNSIEQVDLLLLREYGLLMKAHALKRLDEEHAIHRQAWINQQAKATKQQGKSIVSEWRTFKQFFDYDQLEKDILQKKEENKSEKENRLANLLVQANSL